MVRIDWEVVAVGSGARGGKVEEVDREKWRPEMLSSINVI